MGALPDVYTSYQKVEDPAIREKFEQAWGVKLNPPRPGLTAPPEFTDEAYNGKVKAMFIMGENSVVTDADTNHLIKALENLELLVVQDLFLTETAEYADVVLPAACFAEKKVLLRIPSGGFRSSSRPLHLRGKPCPTGR